MRNEGDVVLVYHEEKPMVFARIEAIGFDVKKDWYQITLLLLTIPSQAVTWILRESYIDGEPFTMGGRNMRLEEVGRVSPERETGENPVEGEVSGGAAKVIPFKKPGGSSEGES